MNIMNKAAITEELNEKRSNGNTKFQTKKTGVNYDIFKKVQVITAGLLILSFIITGRAVEASQKELTIIPERITEIIKVDGNFAEEIWSKSPVSGEFLTFSPVFGEKLGQRTAVWMAYNDKNL